MELELVRVDYAGVGIISPGCMHLLPMQKPDEPQMVAVADNDGILQVVVIKKEDIQIVFKTLPGTGANAMCLGGASGTLLDKIFIACGNEVRAYNKKGKSFLILDTNLTETISSMYVLGDDLFVCGKHIYNHYRDCKEMGSYLCGDCIVDIVAINIGKGNRIVSFIACEGRMIRTIEHARVTQSIELDSSPTTLMVFRKDRNHELVWILFGTTDGKVGMITMEDAPKFHRWLIQSRNNSSGGISCMSSYEYTKGDMVNIVLGFNDGNIRIYTLNIFDPLDQPVKIFTYNCSESISAIRCGLVSSTFDELIVGTYTGRIFGLKNSSNSDGTVAVSESSSFIASDTTRKIERISLEVSNLEQKLLKERERHFSQSMPYLNEFSAIPALSITQSMVSSHELGFHSLVIEVPTAIDNVLLESNVPVELIDAEKNFAVVSYSKAKPKEGNFLLATYRCQLNTNRLEVHVRTSEGRHGHIKAYVTPLFQPKFCQLVKFVITPLSLHARIQTADTNRPYNILNITGNFSLGEIHSWICNLLPEVEEKPIANEKTLIYKSIILDTIFECRYMKGEAIFKSDNISTIAIVKEFVSQEATVKHYKLNFSTYVSDESIVSLLNTIDSKLAVCFKEENDIKMATYINDLDFSSGNSLDLLTERYRKFIKSRINSKNDDKSSGLRNVDTYLEIIRKLYVDYNNLKGNFVTSKMQQLNDILEKYTYNGAQDIQNCFMED